MGRVPSHVSRDDLTSAGLAALVQASKSFDAARGVPFARYAATRVRGAILDELRGHRLGLPLGAPPRPRPRRHPVPARRDPRPHPRPPTRSPRAAGMTPAEVAQNDEDIARAQVLSLQGAQDASLDEMLPPAGRLPSSWSSTASGSPTWSRRSPSCPSGSGS